MKRPRAAITNRNLVNAAMTEPPDNNFLKSRKYEKCDANMRLEVCYVKTTVLFGSNSSRQSRPIFI